LVEAKDLVVVRPRRTSKRTPAGDSLFLVNDFAGFRVVAIHKCSIEQHVQLLVDDEWSRMVGPGLGGPGEEFALRFPFDRRTISRGTGPNGVRPVLAERDVP